MLIVLCLAIGRASIFGSSVEDRDIFTSNDTNKIIDSVFTNIFNRAKNMPGR